jgi:hypothetical protein
MRPGGHDHAANQDARRSRLGIAAFVTLTLALALGVCATLDRAERQNPFGLGTYQN